MAVSHEFVLDGLEIGPSAIGEEIREGQTIDGVTCSGKAAVFRAQNRRGIDLFVADIAWDNGERDVRAIKDVKGPRPVRRLEHGLRMGVAQLDRGKVWVELSQARLKRQGVGVWSNLTKASWKQLDSGSKTQAAEILREAGALQLGKRASLLGPSGTRSNYLVAIFDDDNHLGLAVVYVLTRVLPLAHGYSGPQLSLPLD